MTSGRREISRFTGVSSPYEVTTPALVIENERVTTDVAIERLVGSVSATVPSRTIASAGRLS